MIKKREFLSNELTLSHVLQDSSFPKPKYDIDR